MTIIEILEGTEKVILANIELLAKDYLEKKGKRLNKGCPSCVTEMVLTLKNIYKMTNFKFKRHAASYKDKKGDKTTISNSTMTDEKALKFLKTNPRRIELFSDFPSNWKNLIKGEIETEAEKEVRLAVEAEAIEAAKAAAAKANAGIDTDAGKEEEVKEEVKVEGENDDAEAQAIKEASEAAEAAAAGAGTDSVQEAVDAAEKAAEDAMKPLREDLMKISLKDLRLKYPDISSTSIKGFVDKVLAE